MDATARGPETAPNPMLRVPAAGRVGRHAAGSPATAGTAPVPVAVAADGAPDGPVAVKLRLARAQEQLDRLRRTVGTAGGAGARTAVEAVAVRVALDAALLARMIKDGRTRHWGPSDFEPGDHVLYRSAWYEVTDVGPMGVIVRGPVDPDAPPAAPGSGAESLAAEYVRVTGRRRGETVDLDGGAPVDGGADGLGLGLENADAV